MYQEKINLNNEIRLCYQHLDKFTHIWSEDYNTEENEMPDNVKLTVYCKGKEEEGFLINMTTDELGIGALIAEKFIIHSELELLAGCKIS